MKKKVGGEALRKIVTRGALRLCGSRIRGGRGGGRAAVIMVGIGKGGVRGGCFCYV
jgi:hypothetical protein